MFNIQITPAAEDDIRQAAQWWSDNRSPEQSARWYQNIYQAIGTLKEMPNRCPAAEETIDYEISLRQLQFGTGRRATHRIIFDVSDNDVRIWRVLHLSREELDLNIPK